MSEPEQSPYGPEVADAFRDAMGWDERPQQPKARILLAADVEPERVDWLWPGRVPKGKLVTLDGDPGQGKSTVALDIGARLTTGSPMPDDRQGPKGAVLVLSAEDGPGDTIRPRLDAAGADTARVVLMTDILDPDGTSRPVQLPGDLGEVERVIREHEVVLVILDVLMAYLAGDVNAHRDQDVRRALHQLGALADRTGAAVLCLRHLNKAPGSNALYRGGGSIGIVGAARSALMAAEDPDDDTRHVLASEKLNIGPPPESLAYRLVPSIPDDEYSPVRVLWEGPTGHRSADLLRPPDEDRSERDEAADWLCAYLADHGGEAPASEIIRDAGRDGINNTKDALRRTRKRAGVVTAKSGMRGGWMWRLEPRRSHKEREERSSHEPQPSRPSVRPSDADRPPCAVCGEPMTVITDGQRVHPNCEDWLSYEEDS